MEFCPNGELYEALFYTGKPFSEPITRYLFKQLLKVINYIHQEGLTHRCLCPENILFDEEWNLKIADMSFATLSTGTEGSGMCQTK